MISLVYCGNRKVFPLILLSLLSVARHTTVPVTAYLVTMDLTDRDPRYVPLGDEECRLFERALGEKGRVVLLDAKDAWIRRLSAGKCAKNSYTPYAQGRLLLDEFDLPPRVLYLDSDVMCCSDLAELDAIDLSGYEFAAALDVMGKFWIARDYCNSGVMYLNLEEMKRTDLLGRASELLNVRRLAFPDQSALNKLAKSKLILPRRFNEQRGVREDTVLKHFCQGIRWLPFFKVYNYKQNDVKNVHEKLGIRCFDEIYRQYDEMAREYGFPPLGSDT